MSAPLVVCEVLPESHECVVFAKDDGYAYFRAPSGTWTRVWYNEYEECNNAAELEAAYQQFLAAQEVEA